MINFYIDKQQIINWLNEYEVKNYKLILDERYGFVIYVNGNVDLSNKKLINIPVKFCEIIGDFHCNDNQLASLNFCPKNVGDNFWCSNNKLISLECCPQTVGGSFCCGNNQVTSLEFCPQTVGGNFYCDNNPELKEIQEITDFKLIYLEHKKILITKLSDKLNNDLVNDIRKKVLK